MKIQWIEEKQGLWGFISMTVTVIGVLATIVFGLKTFFTDEHPLPPAQPITTQVNFDAKTDVYTLTVENGTILDNKSGLTFSLSLIDSEIDSEPIRFYKLVWSSDSESGSEAVKTGSIIDIKAVAGYFQVKILSIDKANKSLLMRINKKL
ncbi:MAG: hypothetical protein D3920_06265 [Candidatus Electrothrix sp. AW2]|nr:hypothetical protein [Candidatus Electrothrix gigas]